jgi:pimeloyl-ACP methyl ester carboxylesterase
MLPPVPDPSERVDRISGADLRYWVYRDDLAANGDARTVLMVHGLRGTHNGLELIAAALPRRRVVIPDLPGFGDSGPMSRRHDAEGYAHAMTELIERLGGRNRPVVLLGHSFGSVVAARVASTAPELLHRLVLLNPIATLPLRGPRVVLAGLTSAYYALGKVFPPRMGRSWLSSKWFVLAASRAMTRTKDKQVRRFIDDSHLRYFSRFHSPVVLGETFRSSVNSTVADYARSLTVPTLVIAGETDELAPLAGQYELAARLADVELVVIPEVGHLVHYETPTVAADEIERFLAAS